MARQQKQPNIRQGGPWTALRTSRHPARSTRGTTDTRSTSTAYYSPVGGFLDSYCCIGSFDMSLLKSKNYRKYCLLSSLQNMHQTILRMAAGRESPSGPYLRSRLILSVVGTLYVLLPLGDACPQYLLARCEERSLMTRSCITIVPLSLGLLYIQLRGQFPLAGLPCPGTGDLHPG